MGTRTELKPAFAIASKYSSLIVTPHSPSFGASSALPKFTPRLISLQSAKMSFFSAATIEHEVARETRAAPSQRIDPIIVASRLGIALTVSHLSNQVRWPHAG